MANKKVIIRNKKPNTLALGGLAGLSTNLSKIGPLGSGGAAGSVGMQATKGLAGGLGSMAGGVGGLLNSGVDMVKGLMNPSGNETGVGNALSTVGSLASNIPGVGGIIGAGVNLVGGLVNSAFGSNINEEFVNETKQNALEQSNYVSEAADNSNLLSDWSSHLDMNNVSKSDVGSDGWFSDKAKKKTEELNKKIETANQRALLSLANTAGNIDSQSDLNTMANYSALGGPLNFFKDGGGIHIKKANRGKFTEYCGGKVTSECIARGKKSSNPATRKRATFAANARHWNANGGFVGTNGGDFTNGVITIDEGGLHEENPLTGVPMGLAQDGTPNLVEEGEVLFNNYVFSNRLNANEGLLNHYKLPSRYKDKTFADAAKDINKESSERPNDPISNRGLISGMTRLMQAQEDMRTKEENKNNGRQFAKGGDTNSDDESGLGLSDLRYAPVLGSGLNVLGDLTGLTNKPDYSNADMVLNSVGQTPMVQAKPIGNYLTYNPFDRNFYQNKLNAQAGATRRAIQNTSGGNRAAANAGILAADYNYGNNIGNLARQAEEYNLAQRQQVEQFNRGTNQYNSEVAMRADAANQAAIQNTNNMRFNAVNTAAQMRESIRDKSNAAKSANLTNFFDNLGSIGQEEFSRNMIESNPSLDYSIDRKGKVKFKNKTNSKKKSKGGYLNYGR